MNFIYYVFPHPLLTSSHYLLLPIKPLYFSCILSTMSVYAKGSFFSWHCHANQLNHITAFFSVFGCALQTMFLIRLKILFVVPYCFLCQQNFLLMQNGIDPNFMGFHVLYCGYIGARKKKVVVVIISTCHNQKTV